MNKTKFRLLVFFMSLSLLGIILVQLYWVNSSLKNSEEQFKFHVQQVLGRVSERLEQHEIEAFLSIYKKYSDSTGHSPNRAELIGFYDRSLPTKNKTIIYSDQVTREYDEVFFDKNMVENLVKKKAGKRDDATMPALTENTDADRRLRFTLEGFLSDFRQHYAMDSWINNTKVHEILATELTQNSVTTPFEFGIFNNGIPTKIHSSNLGYDQGMINHAVFEDGNGYSEYRIFISFPEKKKFLFSSIVGITSLSLVFTLIIIIAYLSAINQLIKQKNISEIKTDFINNMTHEFKTPIATINLALDAIKNPKIFDDKEKVQRYLQMIRDENKRMHSQVENVLQISRLDKKELDIDKEQADITDVLEAAIEHVYLIIEARHGSLTRHFKAQRTTVLLNDVHFTNVIVNILDNAIKYSADEPVIDIYTENVKDFVLIKIKDHGLGMNKNTQKRIFEKFYREHTGDRHDVKGHGLGLAYVKQIIDDHNCHIYVESEKGKGSTFIIKMPLIN